MVCFAVFGYLVLGVSFSFVGMAVEEAFLNTGDRYGTAALDTHGHSDWILLAFYHFRGLILSFLWNVCYRKVIYILRREKLAIKSVLKGYF